MAACVPIPAAPRSPAEFELAAAFDLGRKRGRAWRRPLVCLQLPSLVAIGSEPQMGAAERAGGAIEVLSIRSSEGAVGAGGDGSPEQSRAALELLDPAERGSLKRASRGG